MRYRLICIILSCIHFFSHISLLLGYNFLDLIFTLIKLKGCEMRVKKAVKTCGHLCLTNWRPSLRNVREKFQMNQNKIHLDLILVWGWNILVKIVLKYSPNLLKPAKYIHSKRTFRIQIVHLLKFLKYNNRFDCNAQKITHNAL